MLGLDGSIRDLSRPMLDLLGAGSVAEITAGSPPEGILRSLLDQIPSELFRHGNHVWHGRIDHRDAIGRQMLFRATASAVHDDAAASGGDLALLLHDITEPSERMRELVHGATHDPLTGLANRHQLMRQLSQAIADQRTRPGHVAVIFLDLDHLKYVNDAFGHAAGDRLLVSSARRLEQAVRPSDAVARIGGDEFLTVATGVADPISALELGDRARRALTGNLRVGELDLEFSVSVGIALTDADVMDLDDDAAASMLISNADTAMYQSKQNGRGRCTLFTTQMRSHARSRTEAAGALSRSLAEGSIDLDYQPIHSAVSGAAVAAEALAHWTHPTMGLVDAAAVVDIAEESGSIGQLGEFVLERALSDLATWSATGAVTSTFAIHVDVSRVQLGSSSFVNFVVDRLRHHRVAPAQLVLEAQESPLLGRETEIIRSIQALRRFGVKIAIDNIGTGSRALEIVTDVGADVLKLDSSLALQSGSSDADMRLVRAIILLAHALNMDVVAEHVRVREQLRSLRAAGCDMVQGTLIGQPMSAAAADFSTAI